MITRVVLFFSLLINTAQASQELRLIDVMSAEAADRNLPMHDSSRIFFNRVLKTLELPDYAKIVVVGFDNGRTSQLIAEKIEDAKILNFVLSPDLVEYAEMQFPHPRIETTAGDVFRLDRKLRNTADVVFCSWVVGHIPQTKQVVALKTIRHMLKNNGTCAVIYPLKGSELSNAIDQVVGQPQWKEKLSGVLDNQSSYRPDQYAHIMARAGFKNVRAEKHVYSLYFNDRMEFEGFVLTIISRYLSRLNETQRQQLAAEITDAYLEMTPQKPGGQIPYQIDMVLAVGKNEHKTQ